jgi:PAS domain S-box-containing protein
MARHLPTTVTSGTIGEHSGYTWSVVLTEIEMQTSARLQADWGGELQVLWEDGAVLFCRGWRDAGDGNRTAVLAVVPAAEHPTPGNLERLAHEYGLKDELDSAWAARPLELAREHERTLLVLEDPGGEPLDRLLGSPMDVQTFLRLANGIATALAKVHQRGLIHKDLKPAHILVDGASGEVRLTGFGIASRLPREHPALEAPEAIAGTLAYMAPEQTGRMNRSVDARSDLYALGVTLYQMLTGGLPFTASDPMELVHCHIARRPVPPAERIPGLVMTISAIVMKLLAKTAEDRYQTTAGVAADLRRCLEEWEAAGRIEPFELGAQDVPDVLRIPEKLYGREPEVRALRGAFERVVAHGTPALVLVSGYAGIGKSSVVNELHKVVVPLRGLFASGKFDQYQRDIPYATLAQALQALIRQLLIKSEEDLAVWREAMLEALGANGRLIVDLVPELERLIGSQPPAPDLPPREAEKRFLAILGGFLGVFARREHPLVLFIDDLQWLDAATLQFLAYLVTHSNSGSLLAIGAYRDNEVGPAHPLRLMLESVRQAGAPVEEIVLGPLSRDDCCRMVAESVGCGPSEAEPLGQLLHEHAAGNPFFAIQFLTALWEERLLDFDAAHGAWTWDIDAIRARGFTDNVADLMVAKLKRLPAATQEALQRFAGVGNSADVTTLAMVQGGGEEAVHAALWDALREGLVSRRGNSYRFLHDRVQEAAYALIPEDRRPEAHVRIGRRLLAHLPPEAVSERVFEIVNQLNRGLGLLTEQAERDTLRQLNTQAGRRAKHATAYVSARGYLHQATALLRPDSWRTQYEDTFTLQLERCECEYLTGNFNVAQELSHLMLEHTRSDLDRAQVYRLRIRLSGLAGRFDAPLPALREAFRLFGMILPESAADIEAASEAEHREVAINLRGRRVAELVDAPAATEPTVQMLISLIAESVSSAGWDLQPLYFPWLTARGVNVCLGHGHTAESSILYQGYARARVDAGDFQSAFEFADLALRLAAKGENPRLQAIVRFRHGFFVSPWRNHIATSLPYLHQGFAELVQAGDFLYAGYAGIDAVELSLEKGDRLVDVLETCRKYTEVVTQDPRNRYTLRLQQHFIACLQGSPYESTNFEGPGFSSADRPSGNAGVRFHTLRQIVCFLFGRYDEALASARLAAEVLRSTVTVLLVATHHFYYALTLAALYPRATAARQHAFRQTLGEELRQHRGWADQCPENFEHRYALLAAEVARIDGQDLEAMRLYELAIGSAREHGFVQNEGLANELAGRFYLDRGLEKNGYAHLRDAHACYALWGADSKVRHLERLYPRLAAPDGSAATSGSPFQQLDVRALVSASQAVSSEIVFPKLIETLMTIALQNAGADRGLLILPHAEAHRIEAEARASGDQVEVGLSPATMTGSTCPEALLRYVIRTHERVILDDASRPSLFSEDEYLRRRPPRSILCLPLLRQGRLAGLLYLENTLTSHAFTPERVTVLELLAAQAAISLENTRLYSDLQEREAQIRRLVDANILGILFWRIDGSITEANDALLRMLGYSRDELRCGTVGWVDLTPEEHRAADEQAIEELKRSGTCTPFETEYLHKDGRRIRVMVGAALLEGSQESGVAFVLDLTERQRAEEALREAQAELAHVTRLATLGELMASIAHEINQPLGAVVNNASACVRWLAAQNLEEARRSAALVIADGHRAAEIIARIRGLAQKAPLQKDWLDLNATIRDVLALARSEVHRHGVAVEMRLAADVPLLLGDRIHVQQVLLNLLMNAIEAMSRVDAGRRALWVSSERVAATEVLIAVGDSGPGFDPQSLDRLFDAFYTTKPHGLGLGLAISRRIIEAHGGRLWATANTPHGAVLQFTVPMGHEGVA